MEDQFTTQEKFRLLRSIPLFSSLDQEQTEFLADNLKSRRLAAGDIVVRQGDEGSSMFVIAGGQMAILVGNEQEQVATLGGGDYFGEMSLLIGGARGATVRAATPALVFEVPHLAVKTLLADNHELLAELKAVVQERSGAPEPDEPEITVEVETQSEPTNPVGKADEPSIADDLMAQMTKHFGLDG